MLEDLNNFSFSILDQNIEIKSDSDPRELKKISTFLQHRVEITQEQLKIREPIRTLIMTAFLLSNDLMTERSERASVTSLSPADAELAEKITETLINDLEKVII